MKEQIRQIYADLSNGRLSQREALEKIKAIKLQEQSFAATVLAPVWLDGETVPAVRDAAYAERHVVLCDLPADVERLGALLPLSECTLLQTDPEATIAARFDEIALACFEQIQAIFRDKPQGKVLLQAVVGSAPDQVLLAGLAGILKTAALENPQFAGQVLIVPAETTVEALVTRLEGERARGKDTLVRYQEGVRQVVRWEVVHAETAAPASAFDDRGVYLITGGLGGLAVLFAKEILARTKEAKVILAGRSALDAEKQTVLDRWRFGGRVSYRQADVRDFGQVRQLVAGMLHEHGRLDGILHGAGVIADEFIIRKESAQFSAVLAPKVGGTVNLDEATRGVALDFFVLFSSVAGVLGNVAQADYAAANGFMDRFAAYRNGLVAAGERHGRTRSINWPLWQSGGMGSDAASRELLQHSTGMPVMQTATGMQAFHRILALPYDQVLVVEGDASPIVRALAGGDASAVPPRAAPPAIDAKTLTAKTEDYIRQELSEILRLPAQNIDPRAALEKYGIDSIMAMKLTGQLEKSFGALSKTLFFEYQTLRDLAQYFVETHSVRLEELFSTAESTDAQPVPAAPPATSGKRAVARRTSRPPAAAPYRAPESDPIAIIGLSGRYPESVDLDAYWRNLRDGKDCIVEVPADRWDWKAYFSDDRTQAGHHYSKWGGFIAGVDEFDPLFFNISPKEAKFIDPQERLFLQHAWMAIEDAGYTRAALQVAQASDLAGQVGVYAGVMYTEYQLFGADASARGQRLGIAGSAASIANRVSYAFNLHGPSVTLDSMCSSSLTAIHFACQDLKLGRTTLAIAGGVNVSIHPNKYLVLSAGQFISGDGHCQSFGEGGDGYIPGEGVGVVVLKRLSEAERDGDHIYGVIRASALNHGGKTNGYSVPNPQAQASAIGRALAEAKIDARHVSYIEAHGTGTKLGDPIEIAALSKAFRPYTEETGFCPIGSAKSNIGHCESAAGIAGLTKVLLQMQHRQIVPSLHSAQLNPHIDFDKTPFVVNQTLCPWEPPVVDGRTLPRIAGISSFGAGGSNAHLIIEEHRPAAGKPLALPAVAILLSARTPEQLRQKAADLLAFVRPRLDTIDLASVAHTLQAGREAMDERLGLVVASAQQLAARLESYCAGQAVEELFQGTVRRNRETPGADLQQSIGRSLDEHRLDQLLDLWVKGVEIDWRRLYGEDAPRRVTLPTYPFAKERYWIEIQAAAPAGTVLHPLLHRNVSDLSEQRYSSTFTGGESFLAERAGRKVLPAAAYLEMARAAVEQALPERAPSGIVELRDVVWTEPVALRGGRQVHVALFPAGDGIEFEIYSREEADEELVHCSGRAAVIETADVQSLRQGNGQLLARLRLPESAERDAAAYVLHPALVESALHAAAASRGLSSEYVPAALDSLRVIATCTKEMDAWVRDTGTLDIDLCDEQGRVCAQLRGVSWQAAAAVSEAPAFDAPIVAEPRVVREIALAPQPAALAVAAKKKRGAISLVAPRPELAGPTPAAARPAITLSGTTAVSPAVPASPAVRLYDRGEGIFSIEVAGDVAAGATIADLRNALQRARDEASIKVLVIGGAERCFVRGGRHDVNDAVEQKLFEVVAAFPVPVIAAVPGDAIGAGFLFAALCDFMVCSDEGRYGWDLTPTDAEVALFAERFGEARAHDLLVLSKNSTGAQLRARGWTGPIVSAARVDAFAQELASSLAAKPQDALRLLKQHLTRRLAEPAGALTRVERATEPQADADALTATIASLPQRLGLELAADGVLIVTAPTDAKDLESVLSAVGGQAKAVVLAGDAFSGTIDETAVHDFQRVIAGSTIPVVAALQRDAKGNAWLVAQFCDAAVHAEQGVYSAARIDDGAAFAAFASRLGATTAREILLTGADYSGIDLRRRAGTVLAVDRDRVLPTAAGLAATVRKQPAAEVVREIPRALPDSGAREDALVPGPIALRSSVVTATAHPGGIVVVSMEDRQAKNMLSAALTDGMREAFDHIARTPAYKIVVLTGYDHYFSSGGTKENLLAIQAGKARFTDSTAFQLPLDCELPVIAALQGHGIGAGWSLGMFADLALLGEESRYMSPYMGYGFTPGAGATLSLADKIGVDLARESLLTAEPQTGRALKERGLLLPVLPRAEVVAVAMGLAEQIARAPRERLVSLKRQGAAHLREQLDETYRLELAMHEQTFVGRSDTLARIERTFHQEAETPVAPVASAPHAQSFADGDLLSAVTATLRTLLAGELQMRESDIDDHVQFIDLGLDSISGVSWIRKVNDQYQTSIEATKVYSYPTLAQLSLYVRGEAEAHGARGVPAPPVSIAPAPTPAPTPVRAAETRTPRRRRKSARFAVADSARRTPEPIAVIGMAGQFPQARNLEEYWRNIAEGRNCISRVTRERWDVDAFYQPGDAVAGKSNSDWFGALDQYDRFDPRFFNISPTEAEFMDPQQRLFLEACWHGIEHAGYDARTLSGSKCGVFVGCATGDYHQLSRQHRLSAHGFTGNAMSILASRISYFLNLQGPCVSVDTACSSSLVALAQACDSLNAGDSDLAIAGGVYVMAGPEMHIRTSHAGMLSPEGRCFTFDQRADGFVPGEGVGVVVLKRLADAERDGDLICGVVEGWGVNQDGKTNGITAPSPESQTRLMQSVYDKYRIEAANIQLVEAHGTGTKLGDPIEVEALKASFESVQGGHTALGSVKSNIGHCLTAAGVAGVIKLLLALQHKQLPPTINFERLNEHIDLTGSPFYVNTQLKPWEVEGTARRQAAISCFGFSGTNAHAVIGEAPARLTAARAAAVLAPGAKVIVPLSARTPEQLHQKAEDLLAFLRGEGRAVALHELAYTLQVGRAAMEERLGFVVGSLEELTGKIEAWIRGDRALANVHQGQVKRSNEAMSLFSVDADLQETVAKWIANQRLPRLVELWVKGLELDWRKLYGEVLPQRIGLPLYPFARERYWIDATAETTTTVTKAVARGNVRAQLRRLALRRAVDNHTAATLLAAPSWVAGDAQAGPFEYAEHHVITCELSNVDSAELQSLLPQSRCLSLQGNGEDIARRYSAHAVACFQRLQAILRSKPQGDVLVQIAVAGDGERALFAGLSALLKTAALEHPRLAGQLLQLPSDTTAAQLAGRLQHEQARGNDPLVRFESGVRQVVRWQEVAPAPDAPPAFKDHGVYLITGGTGGLGLIFAREILTRGSHVHVVLTGRAPLTAEKQALLDGLSASARVTYRQLDLGDPAQVEQLIAAIVDEHQHLDGILHCAGTTADAVILKKSAPEFAAVLAPKVLGAYHLDRASRGVQLDLFVLFSSVAGALGNAGQADYAAANAFLDHFAAHRNRQVAAGERHGRTSSVNWPLWQDGKMALDATMRELLRQTIGVEPLQTAAGLDSFRRALALPHDQTLVMAGDTAKIAAYLRQARLFDGAVIEEEVRGTADAIGITQLQQRLKTILAGVLRIDAASIDADQAFIDLGLDSFLGAELIVAVNKAFGTTLSHTRLFDYSNVSELALFLEKELAAVPARPEKSAPARPRPTPARSFPTLIRKARPGRRTSDRAPSDDRIAVIGMSGRYPQAGNLGRFWENLAAGRNSITEVQPSRWDVGRYYDPAQGKKDKTYSKWLGAIDDHDCFDPLFFRISPQEAEFMDPQHRLFLQESYRAFEDAGYAVSGLSNQKCGVYLGISTNEYMSLLSRHGVMSAPVTSNSGAIAAARIAYYLNLKGPAISVDTACSSSLVALHLASQAILNGEIDMALAGGVSLWLTADSYVAMSQAGMFSPSGQCKTFDDSADGIVNGEGVGAVVLKRLRDAERDGDTIHGVILGSAINQDGRTNGITAPSVNSQIELERGLYAKHGIDPETINYIEAHGTGTRLGDPIELEALSTVFSEKTTKKNFCALGSVKSNIGHTTSASGVAGLQKVLLSMRHRTLVPTLNVSKETSRFDFQGSPFYLSRETKPWDAAPGSLRRAAVSSFGFSGTNAHLVVEEYPSPAPMATYGEQAFIVPLSARTADQLRQKARDLLAFLRTEPPADLASVAYTLQTGREAMEERLGFLVTSLDQLAEKLAAFDGGAKNIDGMYRGRVEPGNDSMAVIDHDDDMREAIDKWIVRKKLPNLLDLWIRGLSFDWSKLYGADKPRRVSLPVYPFALERYWFQATPAAQPQLAAESRQTSDADLRSDMRSIEDILTQIADDELETGPAVQALKILIQPPHQPPSSPSSSQPQPSSGQRPRHDRLH